jgi:phosphatidylserine/phosphatidylglycerophosphate/cardiolipin synthase-like enzyme
MTPLLVPGLTCAQVIPAPRGGVLADGHDFYRAVYDACCKAEKSIVMTGWQFESNVELVVGKDADGCEYPTELVPLLRALCEQRPELEVHILAWDASPIFTFERQPLQRLLFTVRGHKRIHYKMDNAHPFGASQHQKLIIVDRSIAFVGGMDVCVSRWDNRDRHTPHGRCYPPYHDVQAYVTGEAVDVLRDWFCERWSKAHGVEIPERDLPKRDVEVKSSFEIDDATCIGLARTLPRMDEPHTARVSELFELHMRAIANAEHLIYMENQYFSCDELADAFIERMRRGGPPLEIVIVLPEKSAGFKERISIGVYQQRILERLGQVAADTGHHFGVYFQAAQGPKGDVPVFIHAKVLAVDDRFLLISSANASNRSMGFDTELGVAWEAPEATTSLRRARVDLLAEHVGNAPQDFTDSTDLVARLDAIAYQRTSRLRIHERNVDEKPGWFLSRFIPDNNVFDPDNPRKMQEALPEPGAWLDKLFREPIEAVARLFGKPRRGRPLW